MRNEKRNENEVRRDVNGVGPGDGNRKEALKRELPDSRQVPPLDLSDGCKRICLKIIHQPLHLFMGPSICILIVKVTWSAYIHVYS